jgi:hypothetical protein
MSSHKEVRSALDQHEKWLSSLPHVQGLGMVAAKGEKVDSDDVAVAVYVEEKRPLESLAPDERIPETLEVREGGRVRQVPVRGIEQGPGGLE